MRFVLDTNVLIAAFISRGACHELLEHCALHHEWILSDFILDEVGDKLTNKFGFSARESQSVLRLLRSRAVRVTPLPLSQPVCRDADDDMILATALAGGCDYIITGDQDLLDLDSYQAIKILRPADYWAIA